LSTQTDNCVIAPVDHEHEAENSNACSRQRNRAGIAKAEMMIIVFNVRSRPSRSDIQPDRCPPALPVALTGSTSVAASAPSPADPQTPSWLMAICPAVVPRQCHPHEVKRRREHLTCREIDPARGAGLRLPVRWPHPAGGFLISAVPIINSTKTAPRSETSRASRRRQ
jgi:hypothetical protein